LARHEVWIMPEAQEDMDGLQARQQDLVRRHLHELAALGVAHPNVKALAAPFRGQYAMRAGDWRLRIEVSEDGAALYVLRVTHRSRAYK
jgi:mRNA-degrading endonuclease RelE of RelBE toxin-antitoxin system